MELKHWLSFIHHTPVAVTRQITAVICENARAESNNLIWTLMHSGSRRRPSWKHRGWQPLGNERYARVYFLMAIICIVDHISSQCVKKFGNL